MLNIIIDGIFYLVDKLTSLPGFFGSFVGFFVALFTVDYLPLGYEEGSNFKQIVNGGNIFHILILIGWFLSCALFFGLAADYIGGKISKK